MLEKNGTRFGIAIPQTFEVGAPVDLALIDEHLRRTESLGYESTWAQDASLGTMQTLDPLTLLARAASVTQRMRLGVSVLVMPWRDPIHLTKAMATIDHLSGGRAMLGVGIGGQVGAYPAFGITPGRRVDRFEESIELLKRLWTESDVSFDGRFWQLEGVTVEPKPVQKPHVPIWFGAHVDAALRRSARLGDAWMGAGASTSAAFKDAIGKMREYLDEYGRDPSTYRLAKRVYIAIDASKVVAGKKLEQWFASYYHAPEMARKVSVFGTESEVIDGLGELLAEKPDMLMFNPVYDLMDHAERLARDVIPGI